MRTSLCTKGVLLTGVGSLKTVMYIIVLNKEVPTCSVLLNLLYKNNRK